MGAAPGIAGRRTGHHAGIVTRVLLVVFLVFGAYAVGAEAWDRRPSQAGCRDQVESVVDRQLAQGVSLAKLTPEVGLLDVWQCWTLSDAEKQQVLRSVLASRARSGADRAAIRSARVVSGDSILDHLRRQIDRAR